MRRARTRVHHGFATVVVAVSAMVLSLLTAVAAGAVEKVLILDTTVSGAPSDEQTAAEALGYTVDIVDATTWATMTTADFGAYRAIILGDPFCGVSEPPILGTTAATWGAAVDGNVVINGTDPVWHAVQGGLAMTERGIAFATDAAGRTGAYISLSCYYHGVTPGTPVPMLSAFGSFTVTGVGCFDDAHIVATHPALLGMTDESLSNWSCSVHEAFDSWPGDFTVLAIAEGAGSTYTAPDGSVGIPYVLARGEGLAAGNISLAPVSATLATGASHTLTATVGSGGSPLPGVVVTFEVLSGPHTGVLGTATTGASGQASLSYTGTTAGTDTVVARFTDGAITQTSNEVTVVWEGSTGGNTPPTADAGGPYDGAEGSPIGLNGSATDLEGPLTTTWSYTLGAGFDAGASCSFADPTAPVTTITCDDDGVLTVTLTADDGTAPAVTSDADVTVANADPSVAITAPADLSVHAAGASVALSAALGDPGTNDTHTCSIDWGDGTVAPGTVGGGTCTGDHAYATGGLYTIAVVATDDDGGTGSDEIDVVVFDESTKVTGGGFTMDDGRTSFGFVAKRSPLGDLSGQLQARFPGRMRFHGDTVDSLVVIGRTATWTGTGRWDGSHGYTFEVTVEDNRNGGGKAAKKGAPDRISIVIRDGTGATVAQASGDLQGGNITVH